MGGLSDSSRYPDDWDTRRRQIYQRDGYECQECGAMGGHSGDAELHCHHRTPISQGGSHELRNLVTLCRDCHNKKHDHPIGDTWDGNDESIPTPEDDVPPSENIINQSGETLGEFVQRFNQTESQASEPLSIPDSRTYSNENDSSVQDIPEYIDDSDQSDNRTKGSDPEVNGNDVNPKKYLKNQLPKLVVVIMLSVLVEFIEVPRFEIASWKSVIMSGIAFYALITTFTE